MSGSPGLSGSARPVTAAQKSAEGIVAGSPAKARTTDRVSRTATLMRTRRQNIQLELALEPAAKGEARSPDTQGTEARTARAEPERPAAGQQPSMEAVVELWQPEEGAGACPAQQGGARRRWHDRRRVGRSPEGPLARDQVPTPRWQLHAAAGTAGRDTEGVGRRPPARRADGARPLHPAGGDAGVAGGLGPPVSRMRATGSGPDARPIRRSGARRSTSSRASTSSSTSTWRSSSTGSITTS